VTAPFLQQLTRHEEQEEDQLLRQVVDFYWTARQRPADLATEADLVTVGGFEKDWTLAEGIAS
jgi:hypothetical protein